MLHCYKVTMLQNENMTNRRQENLVVSKIMFIFAEKSEL